MGREGDRETEEERMRLYFRSGGHDSDLHYWTALRNTVIVFSINQVSVCVCVCVCARVRVSMFVFVRFSMCW